MEMSNVTASGPSYGLFDVLFGSAPKEETGDGQEFGPMMDIIKALNKGKEELSQGNGRTDKGTVPEVGKGESPAIKASAQDAMAAELAQNQLDAEMKDRALRERMSALFGIGAIPQVGPAQMKPALQPAEAGQVEMLSAKDINRALKEKSLPGLSEAEQKLLDAVNVKLEQKSSEMDAILGKAARELPPSSGELKASKAESALVKELNAKGLHASDIKSGEAQGATPEKIVSTESYLKMHEAFNQSQSKDAGATKRGLESADEVQAKSAAGPQSLTQNAIAEPEGKGKQPSDDLLGGRQALDKAGKDLGSKVKAPGSGAFAEMMQSLKAEGSHETKDIFLPGTKPEQMRPVLLSEVQHGVNFQAVKGGGEMRLVVHPPELGEVHLKVGTKGGKVEVSVTAENKQVADMIQGGAKELEHSLKDQHLTLAKFEVNVSDQLTVASSDTKSNLSDQFLSQNQNGFSQGMGREDSSSARRESEFNQRQDSNFGSMMDEPKHASSAARMKGAAKALSRSSAGRLDVVA